MPTKQENQAFNAAFDAHRQEIYLFCRQRLDKEDAEDVVVETFHKLWLNREKMVGEAHVRNFLYMVARHRILDVVKKNIVRNRVIAAPDPLLDPADSNTEDSGIYGHVLGELPSLIEALSKQCQEVMKLFMEEKPVAEIADILHIKSKTVYEHRAIAIRRMRKVLEREGVL